MATFKDSRDLIYRTPSDIAEEGHVLFVDVSNMALQNSEGTVDVTILGELPTKSGFVAMLSEWDTANHYFVPAVNGSPDDMPLKEVFSKLRHEVNDWLRSRATENLHTH